MTLDKTKFAIFILTHGRPDSVETIAALQKHGYSGKIYLITDNEDKTLDQYKKRFGDQTITVDLTKIANTFDIGDSLQHHDSVIYKRNASWQIAEQLGLNYFMQFDDDYIAFDYRYHEGNSLRATAIKSLDKIIDAMIDFLEASNATTIAMAQGGDFLGGALGTGGQTPLMRKAMNSWLFRTSRPLKFVGRMNDDVNTYVVYGTRGELIFTPTSLSVIPMPTQTEAGGMTDLYLQSGTYMKSFYTVMMCPSCVKIRNMGNANRRPHHMVQWRYAVPKIINQQHRK